MKMKFSWVNIVEFKMTKNGPVIKHSDRKYMTVSGNTSDELFELMGNHLDKVRKETGLDIDDVMWEIC